MSPSYTAVAYSKMGRDGAANVRNGTTNAREPNANSTDNVGAAERFENKLVMLQMIKSIK